MATLWYSHFDSTPEDTRLLLAEDWAKYIRNFLGDGIKNGGTNLQITADGQGMHVNMNAGYANIQGYFFRCEEDFEGAQYKIDYPPANASNARIDRVVLRLNRTIAARNILPEIILGEPGTEQPPELTRNSNIWEISLAQVRVPAGAAIISPAYVIDERLNPDVCGVIDSLISADTEEIYKGFWEATEQLYREYAELREKVVDENDKYLEEINKKFETALKNIGDLISGAETDIATLQSFSYDNGLELPGTTANTVFREEGSIYETTHKSIDDSLVAERYSVPQEDGSILQRTRVYDSKQEVIKDVTEKVQFLEDGSIKITRMKEDYITETNSLKMPYDKSEI